MLLSDSAVADAPSLPSGRRMSGRVAAVKLVFVIDNMRLGGTELNAVRTAERLDRSRFDLRVVTLAGDGPLTERYRAIGVPIVKMPLRSLYGASMVTTGWQFVRYLRTEGVQIVHAHDMYSNVYAAPWARLAGVPVIITSRRWWHSLPNRKLQIGNRIAFHLSRAVLVNSPQVARSVHERERITSERIWTVSNFVDDGAFVPLPSGERAAMRASWGVRDAGEVVIGCVARLAPVKDHPTLLRAFALLRARNSAVRLVLIGGGEAHAPLVSLAAELGVTDAVTFVGELRDGVNHHRALDVSVLCSVSEGFPNTLVEAMAAGVPIIATAVGGNMDAVADRETGLLVPPGNPQELARALGELAGDAQLRASLGAAGRRRASEHYGASAALASLEGMYSTLLSRSTR
jgi:glycosyltransferase involved in cell wall biosynthesis